jgi:hypothetical protein
MHVLPRHDGVALLPPASRKEDVRVLEDNATKVIAGVRVDFTFISSGPSQGVRSRASAPELLHGIAGFEAQRPSTRSTPRG